MGTGIGTGIGKLNTAPITDCSISIYLIVPFTAFRKSLCLCASVPLCFYLSARKKSGLDDFGGFSLAFLAPFKLTVN